MCGIAGVLARTAQAGRGAGETVSGMVHALRHRGPDGHGVWTDPGEGVALGHARLAVIDLTVEGRQPMVSRSGRLVLTLNGEIYNYVELREELSRVGARFRGASDTEVLLEAMDLWGIEEAMARARGMFALAVWDVRAKQLWLARDRAGKKPLYVYDDGNAFVFASEIKGILAVPGVKTSISRQSLSDYLSLGFVVGPDTIYSEIWEVRPGTMLQVSGAVRERREKRFWSFPDRAELVLSPEQIQDGVEARLKEAVRLRLRADVPVGIFLSGGIDSGLITALAAGQSPRPLNTFTVVFGSEAFDESGPAGAVARRYSTRHQEIRLDPDVEVLLPEVVRAYDEPFADPSALPTFAVSRAAAEHVKVVLNGEGADELFGGYRRIYAMRLLERMGPALRLLPANALGRIVARLPQPRGFRSAYSFAHRFARAAQADSQTRYLLWSTDGFDDAEKARLGTAGREVIRPTADVLRERQSGYAGLPPTAEFMALDFLVGMADCLLPKIDIATMAYGLEGRSPFLDQALVEWVAGIDKLALLAGGGTKPVLRAIARKYLPADVARAPKRGFEIPLVRWMTKDLRGMVRDVCMAEGGVLFDLLDRREVEAVLDRRVSMDDARWAKRVWILFMLASWGRHVHEDRLRRP
jgi:asparagine synthase (glutamine-hydrolysing)